MKVSFVYFDTGIITIGFRETQYLKFDKLNIDYYCKPGIQ